MPTILYADFQELGVTSELTLKPQASIACSSLPIPCPIVITDRLLSVGRGFCISMTTCTRNNGKSVASLVNKACSSLPSYTYLPACLFVGIINPRTDPSGNTTAMPPDRPGSTPTTTSPLSAGCAPAADASRARPRPTRVVLLAFRAMIRPQTSPYSVPG